MATNSIAILVSKLNHGAVVEMFVLDLTGFGDGIYRFCNQVNEKNQSVVWQGHAYTPVPIALSGLDKRSTGTFPRPRLRVSNTLGTFGALIRQFDNLRGAKVTIKRTLATYLDAVNFKAGNALADPLMEFPDEVWTIDRTESRNKYLIEWELANPIDVSNVMLPGRVVRAQHCSWEYRGPDCGYTGGAVARNDDSPTNDINQDRCSHRPSGCKLRFGSGQIPGSFFPGAGVNREA